MNNSNPMQWKADMEAAAAVMSAYDFGMKFGKYNLMVWDRINGTNEFGKDCVTLLAQIRIFLLECLDVIEPEDLVSSQSAEWIEHTVSLIDDILTKYKIKHEINDLDYDSGVLTTVTEEKAVA